MRDYRQAAAALYSVLSLGPPWDWTTMSGLYANTATYSEQFRSLEDFAVANPQAAYARFLLGYHYMVCGYNDEAIEEFQAAVKLEPSDHLAANLVTMLGGTLKGQAAPTETAPVDDPEMFQVDAQRLFGNWSSQRNRGPKIELRLEDDGPFVWTVNPGPAATVLKGEYSLGGASWCSNRKREVR